MTDEERNNPVNQEIERRAKDIYRCYNPLEIDFKFKQDSVWFKIPAHGYKEWEAYLSGHYYKKMAEYIIGQLIDEQGSRMIEERRAKGLAEFLNSYDENRAIWDNVPRMDNRELLQKVFDEVIVGLVEEFGSEPMPIEEQVKQNRADLSMFEQIFQDNAKKKATTSPEPLRPIIKKKLEEEVTVNE